MIFNLSQYISFLVLAVVLAILAKFVVITPPQHALTHVLKSLCFKIIDKANSKFDLKTKEALHINWRKPNLNAQENHLSLTLSLWVLSPFLFSVFVCLLLFVVVAVVVVFLSFLFQLLLSLSLTLIIGILYCLNYSSLLIHLFIARLVIDFIITM